MKATEVRSVENAALFKTFAKVLAQVNDKMARDWFGAEFVEHYAATREWEEREFRKHITDWEMERYFEII